MAAQPSRATSTYGGRAAQQGAKGRHNMTDEFKRELNDTFKMLQDADHDDGTIAPQKLVLAQKIFGFDLTAAAAERAKLNDRVDFSEYMSFMLSCTTTQQLWCEHEVQEVFLLFDREKIGYITNAQFKRTFGRIGEKLSEQEVDLQMNEMDTKNGNVVDLHGFSNLILAVSGGDKDRS